MLQVVIWELGGMWLAERGDISIDQEKPIAQLYILHFGKYLWLNSISNLVHFCNFTQPDSCQGVVLVLDWISWCIKFPLKREVEGFM